MQEVTPHDVNVKRMTEALDDIRRRTFGRWHWMEYGGMSMGDLALMRDELLDHAAARLAGDSSIDETLRDVLRTAAECSLGLLSVGCFPNGDQEILLPLIDERFSTENKAFEGIVENAPTASLWVETFELCLISGLLWEWRRVIGLLLREDHAPAIRDGVPYSKFDSVSHPADRAQMDALACYLATSPDHRPHDWPTVTLRKPDAAERATAARRLDAAGTLTPDQHLLRRLLDDDRQAFEQALVARLHRHREDAPDDPAPRTLLPHGTLAVAALAVQVHGWQLDVHSGYLPQILLGSTDALSQAATGENTLGAS
ncbi:immunity 49 family protein [Embleya sp. MST-111070]|uniref:immunity 49 family protein n=1 Tax=Embleya sp. MST-111070 TaxID=3398231 RepID=UPI003F7364D0